MTREEMKKEALKRMKAFDIYPQIIKDFEEDDKISVSEPPHGAWYWLDDEELKQVREFEQNSGGLVYAVIRSFTEMGTMDSYLFVSKYKEEWEDERPSTDRIVFSYVNNTTYPYFSEYRSIGYEPTIAKGLVRTW